MRHTFCGASNNEIFGKKMSFPAVFLDRDGTINLEVHYLNNPENFTLLPGVGKAIKLINDHGWPVVVITNQSGLARGYFTEKILSDIHLRMKKDLLSENAFVDAIYYCPHHPDEKCNCRKPRTGLFQQAANDLNIALPQSVIIGDRMSDLIPAQKLRCKSILVLTGHGHSELRRKSTWTYYPNMICDDLSEAVQLFLSKMPPIQEIIRVQ